MSKHCLADGGAKEWIIDASSSTWSAMFPIALTADHLRAVTRPLARAPIRSHRRAVRLARKLHLLISAVRYETHGRARKGVASHYVAERLKRGDRVRVQAQAQQAFRPAGGGTKTLSWSVPALASRRFALSCRSAARRRPAAAAGCSSVTASLPMIFSYQTRLQEALADGALTRMGLWRFRATGRKKSMCKTRFGASAATDRMLDGGAYF